MRYTVQFDLENLPSDQEAKLELIVQDALRNAGLSNTLKRITVKTHDIQVSGKIKCRTCEVDVVKGKTYKNMFFCPNSYCRNSEERYIKE